MAWLCHSRFVLLAVLIAGSLAGCLAGCTTIPQTRPCLETAVIPPEPPKVQSQLTGNEGTDIGVITRSNIELRGWGRALQQIIDVCR